MYHSFLKVFTLVILSLVVSACGNRPQVVTGIQVQSAVVDEDVNLSLKADLNLGAMTFPSVALPILHPRGQTPIGSVELLPLLGGKNQIKITMNISALTDISAIQAKLPNGNAIPLIANNPTITVNLGKGAQLYVTIAANAVALGVAVPISTFDGIGGAVGATNLFPLFNIDKVVGAAGLFTGAKGQNGIALVADITQYVNMQDIFVPQAQAELMLLADDAESFEEQSEIKLSYTSQIPEVSQEEKINTMMAGLNRQKAKLQLSR
jgi:hypothetical protein